MHPIELAIAQQNWALIPELIAQFTQHASTQNNGQTVLHGTLPHVQQRKSYQLIDWGEQLYAHHKFAYAAQCFERALTYSQNKKHLAYLHSRLAEIHSLPSNVLRQQDFQAAQNHAAQAFDLYNELSEPPPPRCALAYSLYGDNPVYCETLLINMQLCQQIYPNWTVLVYHDDSVPPSVLQRLAAHGARLFHAAEHGIGHWRGTFWRFLALELADYDVVIMRDADSLLSWREQKLVAAWLDSGKPFHVIRDSYGHTDVILAGLWGARYGLLRPIREWVEQYLRDTPKLHDTHADQIFLAKHVWHKIKYACVHHSSVFQAADSTWLDELPTHDTQQLGSWQTQILPHQAQPKHREYAIFNEQAQEICRYRLPENGKIELPTLYCHLIEQNKWFIKFY